MPPELLCRELTRASAGGRFLLAAVATPFIVIMLTLTIKHEEWIVSMSRWKKGNVETSAGACSQRRRK